MARRPSNPDHGKGFADLSGGVAQKHPFERPLFQALLREGRQDALEVLDRKKELVTLQEGQVLTPEGSDPSPLYFPRANDKIDVTLFDPEEGKKIVDTTIDTRHTVPTAAWFSKAGGSASLSPSFVVRSSRRQQAWMLPALAEFIPEGRRGVLSPEDGVALVKGASKEFSDWLKGADRDPITSHDQYGPYLVSTIPLRGWEAIERAGTKQSVNARTIVTAQSLGANGDRALVFKGRGQWFDRKKVIQALRTKKIDGRELTAQELQKLMREVRPFATIGGLRGKEGTTFIFENAAMHGSTPPAVLVPVVNSAAVTLPVTPGNLKTANLVLGDIKTKSAEMLQHIAVQRIDLGQSTDDNPSLWGEVANLFRAFGRKK